MHHPRSTGTEDGDLVANDARPVAIGRRDGIGEREPRRVGPGVPEDGVFCVLEKGHARKPT